MGFNSDQFKDLEKNIVPIFSDKKHRRQRVGLVALSRDTVIESEWRQIFSQVDVDYYVTRISNPPTADVDALKSMEAGIASCANMILPDADLDAIVYGCTSASMLIGEDKIGDLLTRNRPNTFHTNPLTAAKKALRHIGAKRIAMLTPYISGVNYPYYQHMKSEGFEILEFGAFGLNCDYVIADLDPNSIKEAIKKTLGQSQVDAIFLSCTLLRVVHLLDSLEKEFGVPIISSNQVAAWHVLNMIGYSSPVLGFGSLLSEAMVG